MFHARLQILHVRRRERVLIPSVHGRVDLLHGPTQIVHQRASLTREIVDAALPRATDICIWWQISLRLLGGHYYIYKPIAEQTRTSDSGFGSFRDLNVIINFQRDSHATAFAN